MLENLQPRKYNKNYVEKFVTLLHESKLLKNKYSLHRKKLRLNSINRVANNNSNKGIYITLPKIENNTPYVNTNDDNNNDKNTIPFPQYLIDEEENKNDNNKYNTILTDTIRNILHKDELNNKLESYREREKLLYEILKTKKKFNIKRKNKLYSSTEINQLNDNINNEKKHNYLSPKFIRNFDYTLAKSVERKNAKLLTDNQVKKLYYISELKLFDSFDKIREKNKILNEMKNHQKKNYLNNLDMFRYDKEKWENRRNELNKNINDIMFKKFNSENKDYLANMRNYVDKLHEDKNSIEKDLGPFLNDLNIFIDRNSEYLKDNNPSNLESRLHSNRASFSRKPRMSIKNPKILSLQDKLI
jgi:hypothetical protein